MKHNEISQIVIGRCILGHDDPNAINPQALFDVYVKVLEDIKDGADRTQLMADYGPTPIMAAIAAAEAVEDAHGFEWVRHLEQVAARTQAGKKLKRMAHQLEDGEEVDVGSLLNILSNLDREELDFITMDKVEPADSAWVPSYYEPIDKHIGGYPAGEMMIIAGPAGLGKTTLLLELLGRAAQKRKQVAFYSLELTLAKAAMRLLEANENLTEEDRSYIIASGTPASIEEVYAKSVRLKAEYPDLYMIGIDYADMMVHGEQSEQVMGRIYNRSAQLAEVIDTPVVLIGGMNRGYVGGEPKVNHIRYSGMAEHAASVILLLVNPAKLEVDMGTGAKENLPYVEGFGWIKVGKSRFGTKEGGLGAVQVKWLDDHGRWGERSYGWRPIQLG